MSIDSVAPILRLRDVSRSFGALRAVDGVTLSVKAGERRAMIGPNGAGKTTLFNLIAGELPVSGGAIEFSGRDVTRLSAHRHAVLGMSRTYQITNVFAGLTVEENIMLAVRGRGARKFSLFSSGLATGSEMETVNRVLETCRMTGQRAARASSLSYGQQRQLELAIALATDPRLLLLDEPAAGLSPAERSQMATLIRALPAALTIVLIEHDMDLALSLVESVTCLHFGQVLAEGRPDEIRRNAKVQEVYLGAPADA